MQGLRPEVSVIVPCYNAERFLPLCLQSLAAQKIQDIEMIFIDDGSTDGTADLLEAFAQKEPRAHVLHEANQGVSTARNRGIDMARGRAILFMDADDALEEDGLTTLYRGFQRTGAQIVSANHTVFDMQQGRRMPVDLAPVTPQSSEIVRAIIHMHRIYNNLWNKLYAAELFENGPRLDPQVRIGEDALLNLQLYRRASKVVHLPEYTYVYRVHAASAMAGIQGYSEAHQPMLQSMNRILLSEGIKELYFRDFLFSCVWIDEKERGIREAMQRFPQQVRPLVLDGVDPQRIPQKDQVLFRLVKDNLFPQYYWMRRARQRLLKGKT